METSLLALAIPSLILVPAMGFLSQLNGASGIRNELKRKALHVGTGLTALSFPIFLTAPWMICVAIGVVVAWMIAVRKFPALRRGFGACLHDTQRVSYGEIYFALSVATLMLLTPDQPLLYVIPILILTLADAAAAIVGRLLPAGQFKGFARGKTMSGCVAFAVVAYLTTQVMLLSFTEMSLTHSIGVSIAVAAASCIAELLAKRGLDNALIPAVSYAMLVFLDIADGVVSAPIKHGFPTLVAGF